MESCGVLGKAFAMSSRQKIDSSAEDRVVSSCIACFLGVRPLRPPY